jgi:hypothetical protein
MGRVVGDDKHRPRSEILSGNDAVEVNERKTALHRKAQPLVVDVIGVGTSVTVSKQTVRTERVVVRAMGCRGD